MSVDASVPTCPPPPAVQSTQKLSLYGTVDAAINGDGDNVYKNVLMAPGYVASQLFGVSAPPFCLSARSEAHRH